MKCTLLSRIKGFVLSICGKGQSQACVNVNVCAWEGGGVPADPMTHGLLIFDVLELKFTPFMFVLCVELTL